MTKELPPALIRKVWERASVIPGKDPQLFRKDKCGAIMQRDLLNNNQFPLSLGWEIDHIRPLNKGGSNEEQNLQALQWENNRHKNSNELAWECKVTSAQEENKYVF
ncbi:MAG: HNH endonuclease [Bacteroidia bacterium]